MEIQDGYTYLLNLRSYEAHFDYGEECSLVSPLKAWVICNRTWPCMCTIMLFMTEIIFGSCDRAVSESETSPMPPRSRRRDHVIEHHPNPTIVVCALHGVSNKALYYCSRDLIHSICL